MRPQLVLSGVIPANLPPFDADLQIDEGNYRKHIRYLVDTDGHNRMKEALAILGRIDEVHVRPPLRRVSDTERERIRRVVTEAGLPSEHPELSASR